MDVDVKYSSVDAEPLLPTSASSNATTDVTCLGICTRSGLWWTRDRLRLRLPAIYALAPALVLVSRLRPWPVFVHNEPSTH